MKRDAKKKLVRRLIAWAVALALLAALVIFVFIPIYSKSDNSDLEPVILHSNSDVEKKYVLENDDLLFELEGSTTHFTLTNKRTGRVWHSNPEGAASDPLALSSEKARLQSTLLLTYATSEGATTVFDNYANSIENGVYDIEQEGDEIRVNYVVGKVSKIFFVPEAITKARLDGFLDGMSKRERNSVLDMYQLYDPANKKDASRVEELKVLYPDLENEPVYVMRTGQKDNKKSKAEEMLAKRGYTSEEYAYDMSRLAGNTGVTGAVFNVTLSYRLEGGDLILSVPYDQIRYSANYPIINITPLPYFGAAGTEETGYIMVPEGGGSLIRYNNGKNRQTAYYSNLYGWDYAAFRSVLINETRSNFPVFAMTGGSESFLCILEEGASLAAVNADVSGRNNSYNTASVTYTVLHNDQYQVSAKTVQRIYMFEAQLPDLTVTQRYRFLDTDNYVEMAREYGDYLIARDGLTPVEQSDVPLAVSLVGAIEKTVKRLGVPVTASVALTTAQEAGDIVETLNQAGLTGLSIRYEGWANGGISQKVFTSVKPEKELGGASGIQEFISGAQRAGNTVYLDGMSAFTYRSGVFQGFNYFADAAKHTTRDRVKLYPYSPIFFTEEKWKDSYYLAKPAFIAKMADNFAEAARDMGASVSYRDMGYLLSGDYDPRGITTREEVILQQKEILTAARESGLNVMIRSGNDYALGQADLVADMDLFGIGYSIVDEDIPFYQIAVHGYLNYASESLNTCGDWETYLLRSAEYGSGLSFTLMASAPDVLVDTYYTAYTGASWDAQRDEMIRVFSEYREAMRGINDQRIVDHRYIDREVTLTEYENGTRVYVNFSYDDAEAEGVSVPARSYVTVREGDDE